MMKKLIGFALLTISCFSSGMAAVFGPDIHSQNTLQTGTTAYPQYLNTTTMTVYGPASIRNTLTETYGVVTATLTVSSLSANQCVQTGAGGTITTSGATCSSGGGSSSSLAVGTGTAANFTNKVSSPTSVISLLGTQFIDAVSGTTNFISLNGSSVTLGGVLVGSGTVSISYGVGVTTITGTSGSSVYAATATVIASKGIQTTTMTMTSLSPGVMHIVSVSSNVTTALVSLSTEVTGVLPLANMTAGATYYIRNQTTLQTGATFYVSSGTVRGIFTVEQPDDDTGNGPVSLRTLTTQEAASNMYHSMILYGLLPNVSANGGEFIITTSSVSLDSSIGSFADRTYRPEIAMAPGNNQGGGAGQVQYIGLRAAAHQFPETSPYGDFAVLVGTNISQNPLQLNSVSASQDVCTDGNKILTTSGCGSLLGSGSTNYIQNRNSLQSGATAYPAFMYVGSSATIPTLVIGSLSGVLKATGGLVSGSATTTDLTEGTNLYYTTARATTAISGASPITNTNGVIGIGNNLPAGSTSYIGVTAQYVASVTATSPLSASTSGTAGSTVTIVMSNNLPGGSTSYVGSTALYVASVTTNASLSETFTGTSGATVTLSVNVSSISLPNSAATAGSYTNASITIDSHGLVTSASSGSSGGSGSTLAVATGSVSGYTTPVSSPTAVINFSTNGFSAQLTASNTAFITLSNVPITALSATVVLTTNTQTISGAKTFTANTQFSPSSTIAITINEAGVNSGANQYPLSVGGQSLDSTTDSSFPIRGIDFTNIKSGGSQTFNSKIGLKAQPGEDIKFIISGSSLGALGYTDYTVSPYPLYVNVATNSASYGFIGVGIATPTSGLHIDGRSGLTISSGSLAATVTYSTNVAGILISTNIQTNGTITVVSGSTNPSTITTGLIVSGGPIITSSATPTISSCGSTPNGSVVGNDFTGKITIGGGVVTACTMTFAATKANAPACTIASNVAITAPTAATTTTALTLGAGATFGGDIIMYNCQNYQ